MADNPLNALLAHPVEHAGVRVLTLAQVDALHGRRPGTARKRFNDHRHRMTDGRDFFEIPASVIRTLGLGREDGLPTEKMILLAERGYSLLVKSFTDELSWKVQGDLVEGYFRRQEAIERMIADAVQAAVAAAMAPVNLELKLAGATIEVLKAHTKEQAGYIGAALGRRGAIIRAEDQALLAVEQGQRLLLPDAGPIRTVQRSPRRSRNPLPRPTRQQLGTLLREWATTFAHEPVRIHDVLARANDQEELRAALEPFGAKANVVAQVIARHEREQVDRLRFVRRAGGGRSNLWAVELVPTGAPA